MIRRCLNSDLGEIFEIVNDAATAYKGIIPDDRYHEPYMPMDQLMSEWEAGVQFWRFEENGALSGVMGIQDKGEVSLIRHAYVRSAKRSKGIGGMLIKHLLAMTDKPVLIGTWRAAAWAIRFYEKHGFQLADEATKERLLRRYWNIPDRQIETSVVLCGRQQRAN